MRWQILLLFWFIALTIYPMSAQSAAFETVDCDLFRFFAGRGRHVDCGYLIVPEDYNQPDGNQIRLAVAIFRHPDGNPEADPIIYLEGGPGGSALETVVDAYDARYQPLFVTNRDIIVFDQRGVGFSEPALDCPEYIDLNRDLFDLEYDGQIITRAESDSRLTENLRACGEVLSAQYDLSQYNSANSARDIESLRIALDYEQVNLWGVSYGTRLALTTMRDYPASIRSVVLDSVYPPEVNLFTDTPASWTRALDALFDACAADSVCNTDFPDLREIFFAIIEQLNDQPVRLSDDSVLDGVVYHRLTFLLLYDSQIIHLIPAMIQNSRGDLFFYKLEIRRYLRQYETISIGMHYAVQCREELAFTERGAIQAAYAAQPELQVFADSGINLEAVFEICTSFNVGAASAIENEPVRSDIPTLIFAGSFDPITPPEWGQLVQANLANSVYLEFPTMGHAVTGGDEDCPQQIASAFFVEPTTAPDASCIDTMELHFFSIDPELPDSAPRL